VLDLVPPTEFADGQKATFDLLRDLNLRHREKHPGVTELDARIASYELAYRMQSAALEVGDLEKESPALRKSYGLEHEDKRTAAFARKCLLARRLVERGVRFVQVYDMPTRTAGTRMTSSPKTTNRALAGSTSPPPRCSPISKNAACGTKLS
jgi:hypothetical protein